MVALEGNLFIPRFTIVFTISIQQYFQNLIDDSHIYHFLKVLLDQMMKSVSNESKLMQSSWCHLRDKFRSSLEKRTQRLRFL